MSPLLRRLVSYCCFFVIAVFVVAAKKSAEHVPDLYTLKATDIDGNEVSLEQFRGHKVSLVVNIANACGYADRHYRGLGRMLDIIGPEQFVILAFPCNQFGGQEPGTADEIKNHILSNYGAEYPIFKKTDVVGSDAHPVYKNLAAQWNQAPDWNFWKYLVDVNGRVLNAWGPKDGMEDIFLEVRAAVLRLQNDSEDIGIIENLMSPLEDDSASKIVPEKIEL